MDSIFLNKKIFSVVKLLGKGKGGYSYLVTDGEKNYCLKQIHHKPCSYYNFGNKLEAELRDYKTLLNCGINIPKLIDVDIENERILKEYIEGDTIYNYVKNDKMEEIYFLQIKNICEILYKNGINIDYFPTNFIVNNKKLWYIDYECNNYMEEWNFENWGVKYWSKTPEFIEYDLKNNKE